MSKYKILILSFSEQDIYAKFATILLFKIIFIFRDTIIAAEGGYQLRVRVRREKFTRTQMQNQLMVAGSNRSIAFRARNPKR